MTTIDTAAQFVERLEPLRSAEQAETYKRLFPFNDDDIFMGVGMGKVFALARESLAMPLAEIEKLLNDQIHEYRVGACSIMDKQARRKKATEGQRKDLYDLYLRSPHRINNWGLVDLCAPFVIGGYLAEYDKPRDILYDLARSEDTWQRRTAIVSTLYFIRFKSEVDDTFRIAEILLDDEEDLIHKATGWGLRSAGGPGLIAFLDRHAATMPRVALRYAIEHLDKDQRDHYLSMKKRTTIS
jgi:3-methyladenine DNA glycosylase AlkD